MKLTVILCTLSLQLLAGESSISPELLAPYTIEAHEAWLAEQPVVEAPVVGMNYGPLDMMLKKHVTAAGKVDYASFKNDPNLSRFLRMMEAADPSGWSTNEQKAFWINVYNIYTIKLIIDNYPVKSINDIGSPWDKKFINIAGKSYSLNQVENEILRPRFNDPRVHFGINCASISCPKLHNAAFTASNLDSKLNKLTKEFVNDKKMNELNASSIKVSKIFDWYGVDFKKDGTLLDWLNKYSDTKINSDAKLTYANYDWNLNKQ